MLYLCRIFVGHFFAPICETPLAMQLAIQPSTIRIINRGKFKGLCDTRNLKCVKRGHVHGLCSICGVMPYFELSLRNEIFMSPDSEDSVSSEATQELTGGSLGDFNPGSEGYESSSSNKSPYSSLGMHKGLGLKYRDLDRQLTMLLNDLSDIMGRHVKKLHPRKRCQKEEQSIPVHPSITQNDENELQIGSEYLLDP